MKDFFKNYKRSIKLIYKSRPMVFLPLALPLMLMGLVPILEQNAIASFIDRAAHFNSLRDALPVMFPFFIAIFIDLASPPLIMRLQGDLTDQLIKKINFDLQTKINEVNNLSILEDPNYYNDIELIEGEISWRPINLLIYSMSVLRMVFTLIIILFQLAIYRAWIPIVMIVSLIPQSILLYKLQVEAYENTVTRSPLSKILRYFSNTLLKRDYAKERISFGFGKKIQAHYEETFKRIYDISKTDRKKKGRVSLIMSSIGAILILGLTMFFIDRVIKKEFSIGNLSLFIGYIIIMGSQSISLIQEGALLFETLIFMNHYFSFLEKNVNILSGDIKLSNIEKIEFKNVYFKYPNSTDYALKNISFSVHAPNNIAIVGINGSGKTTLLKLILRLYDLEKGEILINDTNIKEYDLDSLRSAFGILFQDFNKYELSLKENVVLSDINNPIDEKRLRDSLETSGVNSFIGKLNNNIESKLGKLNEDRKELSGGEWQKLATARAFYRKSSAKIFDEPSSALDPISEKEFWDRTILWGKDNLSIFTTHRILGIKNADQYIVLKNGELVEMGSFDELMKREGELRRLVLVQQD